MTDVKFLPPDHPKAYARWTVVIGGGETPTEWAKKPPTICKSTAKFSHTNQLEPARGRGEGSRV